MCVCYWISSLDTASILAKFTRKEGADFILTLIYFWTKSVQNWPNYGQKTQILCGFFAPFSLLLWAARAYNANARDHGERSWGRHTVAMGRARVQCKQRTMPTHGITGNGAEAGTETRVRARGMDGERKGSCPVSFIIGYSLSFSEGHRRTDRQPYILFKMLILVMSIITFILIWSTWLAWDRQHWSQITFSLSPKGGFRVCVTGYYHDQNEHGGRNSFLPPWYE